jgi:Flp pilus assembly protein TadD
MDEAIVQCQKALEIKPNFATAHNNLGAFLLNCGRLNEAVQHFQESLRLNPDSVNACNNLCDALIQQGRLDAAIQLAEKNAVTHPAFRDTIRCLKDAQTYRRKAGEAIARDRQTLKKHPDDLNALNNLAWALATSLSESLRNGEEAVALARRATKIAGPRPEVLDTLAAAYAEAGQFSEATTTAQKALQLAALQGKTTLVESLKVRLAIYESQKPFRPSMPAPSGSQQTPVK